VDDLWATKNEDVWLIVHAISIQIFNLCGHDPPTSQTDGQTEGPTTCDCKTALCTIVHRAVKHWFWNKNFKTCFYTLIRT